MSNIISIGRQIERLLPRVHLANTFFEEEFIPLVWDEDMFGKICDMYVAEMFGIRATDELILECFKWAVDEVFFRPIVLVDYCVTALKDIPPKISTYERAKYMAIALVRSEKISQPRAKLMALLIVDGYEAFIKLQQDKLRNVSVEETEVTSD